MSPTRRPDTGAVGTLLKKARSAASFSDSDMLQPKKERVDVVTTRRKEADPLLYRWLVLEGTRDREPSFGHVYSM